MDTGYDMFKKEVIMDTADQLDTRSIKYRVAQGPTMDFGRYRAPYFKAQLANQSRTESAIETAINVGTGFLLSWGVWMWVVAPVFDIPAPASQALAITAIFTVTSVLRSYFWRRFFANSIHRRIHKWINQ